MLGTTEEAHFGDPLIILVRVISWGQLDCSGFALKALSDMLIYVIMLGGPADQSHHNVRLRAEACELSRTCM
ncbi:MAG: hypothetical protein ACKPKO_59810, partial [Candidatus Fonsibacter sp.]